MATINNNQQKLTPCLWFDSNAEEAVDFYISVFKESKKGKVALYGKGAPMPEGTVLTVQFEIEGQEFLALNGGPYFTFSEAISFVVNCTTQKEIDYYWETLSKGGSEAQCGWLKDKFGLSWQVVPAMLGDWLSDQKAEKASRVMEALMPMKKLDLATLQQAYEGSGVIK